VSRVAFHRPARLIIPDLPTESLVVPAPPEVPEPTASNSAWTLVLPLLSSVGMAAYMVSFGRATMIIIGVMFFLTSTTAVIFMRLGQRRSNGVAMRKQRLRYRNHLHLIREQAREIAHAQRTVAALRHPEPSRLWSIATARHRVWERRQGDADFLKIRLGCGSVALATPLKLDPAMEPLTEYDWESLRAANRLVDRLAQVVHQPMVVDIGGAGVVSLLGPRPDAEELARVLLCQIGVFHAPADVLVAVEAGDLARWGWAKWLPHTMDPEARGEAGELSLVAESPAALADFLEVDLKRRTELMNSRRGQLSAERGPATLQRLVVLFTRFDPFSEWGRGDLMTALMTAAGPQLGITLVFLVEREADEPSRVDLRIRCPPGGPLAAEGRAALVTTPTEGGASDRLPIVLAELVARTLAPLRLSDEHEQLLSRVFSLTEMILGGDPVNADLTRWTMPPGHPRMLRAPIGTDGDGATVMLDIKESALGGSGPHGLIVGATGSGKSELLRTLVMGLALTHPPELLSFVLIDFKGGAAFAPLVGLPHVAGLITNLADDAAMIDRVFAALVGEQQRRQRMLRDAGNLDTVREYQIRRGAEQAGPDGTGLEPLPSLLIVVDEFGELLSGRPDFAELFVQIGRVGRSLGMHLLLATQRLEEGRLRGLDSHLSYRICLRTFSAAESRTVIGTADAYHLPSIPGSAYLKVDETVYRRFRVAHVSAPYVSAEDRELAEGAPDLTIAPFQPRGESPMRGVEPAETAVLTGAGRTELQIVVERLMLINNPVHQVWLPPLPAALALDHFVGPGSVQPGRGYGAKHWPLYGTLSVPIGLIDLPVQQQQDTLVMDFGGASGQLAAVGGPRTGRSTVLRTILVAGMLTHSPDELQFYCIDFGGGSLHALAAAPHVGSVAGRSEGELISRMFAEIRSLIGERERVFRELGVESILEFRERRRAGSLPAELRTADVFLMIDNWGAVRGAFDWADEALAEIAALGLGAGVHVILTAARWMEIRPALRDSIGTRVELRLNDPTESEVNRRLAARIPMNMPGRGLTAMGVYCQFALPRTDGQDTVDGLREAQEDVIAKIAAGWSGRKAPPIRLLPAQVELRELALDAVAPTEVPIGLAEENLLPVTIDLVRREPHFLVFGDAGSGKSTFLRTWLSELTARQSPWDIRVILVDYRHALLDAVPSDHLGAYAGDAATAKAYVEQVGAKLTERLPPPDITPERLRNRDWWDGPELYLVADDYDLLGTGASGPLAPLAAFLPQAREVGLHVILARRVSGMSRTLTDPLVTRIREMGCGGLVLSGDQREGTVLGDVRAAALPPGRGILIERGRPHRLVQVAVAPPAPE
jgi:ESX secretion system protein EccC